MLALESSDPKNVAIPPLSPTLTGSTTSTAPTASTKPDTLTAPVPSSAGHAVSLNTGSPGPGGLKLHLQWFALLALIGGSVALVSHQCPLDMHEAGVGQMLGCAGFYMHEAVSVYFITCIIFVFATASAADALLRAVIPLNLSGSDWTQVAHLLWFLLWSYALYIMYNDIITITPSLGQFFHFLCSLVSPGETNPTSISAHSESTGPGTITTDNESQAPNTETYTREMALSAID
ncbi:hypothetical protein BS17DRAFT_809911 [Gyrodon lividus]|nr:hypothetical protein BS17DRAFT_809911 [Gyrodon lividus]